MSNHQTTLNQRPSQDELLQLMHQAQLHESSTAQGSAAIFKKRPKTKATDLSNTTPIITVDYTQFSKLTKDLLQNANVVRRKHICSPGKSPSAEQYDTSRIEGSVDDQTLFDITSNQTADRKLSKRTQHQQQMSKPSKVIRPLPTLQNFGSKRKALLGPKILLNQDSD